jgi:hypothetical protein
MYSLALIIFVVSEKKAFEHFPRFLSETTLTIETKLPRNDHWKVLYKIYVVYADRKSKMAATAIGYLGFPIGIKSIKFAEDLPMIIPGQFGFNCSSSFREEAFCASYLKPLGQLKPNCPGMIMGRSSTKLYFLCRSEIQDGRHLQC